MKLIFSDKFKKWISLGCIFLLMSSGMIVFAAEEEGDANASLDDEKNEIIAEQEDLLKSLKKRLRHSVRELEDIEDSISEFHFNIAESEARIDSLEDQIANIDTQIMKKEEKIVNVTRQIGVKELEIGSMSEQLEIRGLQIEEQADILSAYLTFLYFQDSTFYDNRSREFNLFKLILDDNTFSENISEIKFLELFQSQGVLIFERLIELEDSLKLEQDNLEVNRRSLKLLRQSLRDEQTDLEALKEGKHRLIAETEGKQEIFEKLAAKEMEEEEQIATEISMLTLNIHAFDTALAKIKRAGNQEEIDEAIKIRDDLLNLKERAFNFNEGDGTHMLSWPISPYRGLTAYFDDSGYEATFGVPHRALDIRAPQGSPIFAPADGIVFKTKGKGSDDIGYHYIIITHRNGIQTLYGHTSKIIVSEGEFVRKGDIIGLSGGTIATTGAGVRTTGPHLHFEVHKFGSRVDPLDHLPLGAVPAKYIPEDKLKELYEEELETMSEEERAAYEWEKKAAEQIDANEEYESDTPTAEEILENDAFDYLEQYEKLIKQYEG